LRKWDANAFLTVAGKYFKDGLTRRVPMDFEVFRDKKIGQFWTDQHKTAMNGSEKQRKPATL
jgi:hypothetical protein